MIKRQPLLGLFLLLFSLTLTACAQKPLKIGLMVDLTGRASEVGISGRNGAELAADEINQAGGIHGRKLELIVKDDKGLPDEAVKADTELVKEGVLLGIGHMASGTGVPGLQVFSKAGLLMISPTMSTESLTGLDDAFIRVIDSNKVQGQVLADAALNVNHNKRVAVMYETNNKAYTLEVCLNFQEAFIKGGGEILMAEGFVSSPGMDFDAIANQITATDADGALIVAGGLDLAIITQKIKQRRPDMDIYSGMWAMTNSLIENGGTAIEGLLLPGVCDAADTSPEFLAFREKYTGKYGEEPTFVSVYSYETVHMIAKVLEACGNHLDAASIKSNLFAMASFDGLQDDFSIDSFGDTQRGYYLFQVQNAGFKRIK